MIVFSVLLLQIVSLSLFAKRVSLLFGEDVFGRGTASPCSNNCGCEVIVSRDENLTVLTTVRKR